MTGLAFHRLQQEKRLLDKENEDLKNKIKRLKEEFMLERERLTKARYFGRNLVLHCTI